MKEYSYHDVNLRGTIEKVTYRTTNQKGEQRNKYALVYLPRDYDPDNYEKRYDILYLIHGGGGSQDAWLDCCKIKNMLDYGIDTGEFKPLIVVFPTYYKEKIARIGGPDRDFERGSVLFFQRELGEELLTAVEGKYLTYAENSTPEALRASRDHRAIGGFSMGSCTTWFAFMQNLDKFSRFLPFSGDCWAIEAMGGGSYAKETAEALRSAVKQAGFSANDFRIYSATGTLDPANHALTPQIEAMKRLDDTFVFDDDFSKGNAHFFLADGKAHCYEHVYDYLYTYLPYLFA